jgi:hypothetical protein
LKGLAKEDEELWKYNQGREWVEYEIGQRIITMKTTKKKIKQCSKKHEIEIVKFMCL